MEPSKWIHDVVADELVNLKDVTCIYKHDNVPYSGDKATIAFRYTRGKEFYLQYDSVELRDSAFLHYANEINAKELDAKQKPLTL